MSVSCILLILWGYWTLQVSSIVKILYVLIVVFHSVIQTDLSLILGVASEEGCAIGLALVHFLVVNEEGGKVIDVEVNEELFESRPTAYSIAHDPFDLSLTFYEVLIELWVRRCGVREPHEVCPLNQAIANSLIH